MEQRVTGFLVVLVLMFFQAAEAQEKPVIGIVVPGLKIIHYQPVETIFQPRFSIRSIIRDPEQPSFRLLNMPTGKNYVDRLGFFCKKELQLDKLFAVPVRFRLGSKEYMDRLEGKNR